MTLYTRHELIRLLEEREKDNANTPHQHRQLTDLKLSERMFPQQGDFPAYKLKW